MKEGKNITFDTKNKLLGGETEAKDKDAFWQKTARNRNVSTMSDEELWNKFGDQDNYQIVTYVIVAVFVLSFIMILVGALFF